MKIRIQDVKLPQEVERRRRDQHPHQRPGLRRRRGLFQSSGVRQENPVGFEVRKITFAETRGSNKEFLKYTPFRKASS